MHKYLWQLGGFFLCSPDCPKQPGTSFLFYKFFYPIVSAKVSDSTIVQNLYFKIFYNKNYQISRNVLFLFVLNTVNLLNTPLSVISADFLFYQTNQFYIKWLCTYLVYLRQSSNNRGNYRTFELSKSWQHRIRPLRN